MTFDNDMVRHKLDIVCKAINEDGFYVGFNKYDDVDFIEGTDIASCIVDSVKKYYSTALNDGIKLVNPHCKHTVLFKAPSHLFKAYPIINGDAFEKFFMPSWHTSSLTGVVLVSHKLKMMSFLYACYDFENNEYDLSFWLECYKTSQWLEYIDDKIDSYPSPNFTRNPMHANYKSIFQLSKNSCFFPWEICLSIEDHWKNELLYEKVCAYNDVSQMKKSISSAKILISNVEKKIDNLAKDIEDRKRELEKYKIDLYTSRVDGDLMM